MHHAERKREITAAGRAEHHPGEGCYVIRQQLHRSSATR
jgi:hypothetical protein